MNGDTRPELWDPESDLSPSRTYSADPKVVVIG